MEQPEIQQLQRQLREKEVELRSREADNARLQAALSAALERASPAVTAPGPPQVQPSSQPQCQLTPLDIVCLPEEPNTEAGHFQLRTATLESLKAGAEKHGLSMSLGVMLATDSLADGHGQLEYRGYQGRTIWISHKMLKDLGMPDHDTALKLLNRGDMNLAVRLVAMGFRKTFMLSEQPQGIMYRMVMYHDERPSELACMFRLPVNYLDEGNGTVSLAWLSFVCPQRNADLLYAGYMREHMALKYTPSMVTLTDGNGRIAMQNATSLASIGFQGADHRLAGTVDLAVDIDYLAELLNHDEQLYADAMAATRSARSFTQIVPIRSPLLKRWLGAEGQDVWHEVQITALKDPVTKLPAFIVAQTDVSNQVHNQQALDKLKRQQERLLNGILPAQVVAKLLRSDEDDEDDVVNEAAEHEQFVISGYDSPALRVASTSQPSGVTTAAAAAAGAAAAGGTAAAGSLAGETKPTPDVGSIGNGLQPSSSSPAQSDAGSFQSINGVHSAAPHSNGGLPHGALTQAMLEERTSRASSTTSTRSRGSSLRRSALQDPVVISKLPQPSSSPAEQDRNLTHAGQNSQSRTNQLRKVRTPRPACADTNGPNHFGSDQPFAHIHSSNGSRGSVASSVDLSPRHFIGADERKSKDASAVGTPLRMQRITLGDSFTGPAVHDSIGAAVEAHAVGLDDEAAASTISDVALALDHLVDSQRTGRPAAGLDDVDPDWADEYDDTATESESGMYLSQQDVMALSTFHEAATILFADIKGFTSMCAQLHPAQVMLFLNSLYNVFDSLCEVHDVYKVETIGDCYMVAGGLFGPSLPECSSACRRLGGIDPQHAQKVVNMAKAMVTAASRLQTPLGQPVEIRVGIHSGSVMSGVVGRRCPRFCLFGASVNCASRMESTGKPGLIHVSQDTRDLTAHEDWVPTEGGVFAKGYGQVQTFILGGVPAASTISVATL